MLIGPPTQIILLMFGMEAVVKPESGSADGREADLQNLMRF